MFNLIRYFLVPKMFLKYIITFSLKLNYSQYCFLYIVFSKINIDVYISIQILLKAVIADQHLTAMKTHT